MKKENSLGTKSESILTSWISKLSQDTSVGNIFWIRKDYHLPISEKNSDKKPMFEYKLYGHIFQNFQLSKFSFSVIYSNDTIDAEIEQISLKFPQESIVIFDGEARYKNLVNAVLNLEKAINIFYNKYLGIHNSSINSIRSFINKYSVSENKEIKLKSSSLPLKDNPLSNESRLLFLQLFDVLELYTKTEKFKWFIDKTNFGQSNNSPYVVLTKESYALSNYLSNLDENEKFFFNLEINWYTTDENNKILKEISININTKVYIISDFSRDFEYYPELREKAFELAEIVKNQYKDFGNLKPETMNFIKSLEKELK